MKRIFVITLSMCALTISLSAQDPVKPRVYIIDSEVWKSPCKYGNMENNDDSRIIGDMTQNTIDYIDTIHEKCNGVSITYKKEKADYVLLLEASGGLIGNNRFLLFNKDGDLIKSLRTKSLGSSVKAFCETIQSDKKPARGNDSAKKQH